MSLDYFKHVYIDNQQGQTICLLHGTGADEYDLIPLVEHYRDGYNILSLRGNVKENGMNRFFARKSLTVFDQASIDEETFKLSQFLEAWYLERSLSAKNMVFLGYSNGANMILATCFAYPHLFSQLILLHCMLPYQPTNVDLTHVRALVSWGEKDTMIPSTESMHVVEKLQELGAVVETAVHHGGHEIREVELLAVKTFITKTNGI